MKKYRFQKALPVWAAGREKEMNCELAFRMVLPKASLELDNSKVTLVLAASTVYRVWVNGNFVAAGPARAAHGFYRVDELELTEMLSERADNILVIEVVGYNVNSYDTLDQPSFLTAELLQNDVLVACTGDESVQIYDLHQRIRCVQRYSFQRAFVECYSLQAEKRAFFTKAHEVNPGISLQESEIQLEKNYIFRSVGMPMFEPLVLQQLLEVGKADFEYQCLEPIRDRSYLNIGDTLKGFRPEELEESLSEEGQNIAWLPSELPLPKELEKNLFPMKLENGYGIYAFPFNATGFLRLQVKCTEACSVYLLFDEILCDGKVNFLRLETCNCFKYKLDAGVHDIMTFVPYTMKYVQVAAKGTCSVLQMDMVEYKHPLVPFEVQIPENKDAESATLKLIYQAALESYLANSVDVFSDCPSRERTGWLCDSFFTSRVEYVLTGQSKVERAFLENFLIAEGFPHLPKGMLPMCYPADHNDGNFIPNWAMWFVLELEEYQKRSGDDSLIQQVKERVYALLQYFERFENEYGLLEKLEGWIFVEWSRANDVDVVQDVNFPSNMIYAKMLRVAGTLYHDNRLVEKAEHLKEVIRERSIRNSFYTDNERRTPEGLINPGICTEVCQYYAFFSGIATKEEDAELWEILRKDFGPQRKKDGAYPNVAFANAFIGNYLRIELLYQDKQYTEVIENILGYFEGMARQTGTLWEHDSTVASCNHGFASHVIYWLAGIYGIGRRLGRNDAGIELSL